MKSKMSNSIKIMLLIIFIINSNLLSQDLKEQIESLLHQDYSSNLMITNPLCEIDKINDYYLEYETDDTIEQLAGCVIFIAWDSVTTKSNIGIYSNNSILWLSEAIDFYRGGIIAIKDINKDNKVEIIAGWANARWDHVGIFQWVDSTAVKLNEIDDGYSNISVHEGTIMLEDIDGDGIYEITGSVYHRDFDPETDEAIEVEVEYIFKWNGSKYVSWEDPSEGTEQSR
jgi:hypothetical protein